MYEIHYGRTMPISSGGKRMTETKKLRRLSRAELLELLLAESRETERLRQKLEMAEAALADRHIRMETAGDLANAVIEFNGVMQTAQSAAQQYLENIARMERETEEKCRQILAKAQEDAQRIRSHAAKETLTLAELLEDVSALLEDTEEQTGDKS